MDAAVVPQAEGYRLRVSAQGISIIGHDEPGLLHGAQTLAQWVLLHRDSIREQGLPGVEIVDWPGFRYRGFTLDISRDRVPTNAALSDLVGRLGSFKLNQLQLYMEHTFAYPGHEAVWRDASPLSGEDVEGLDRQCQASGVELVPNQNSFGHMHRWLRHPSYRHLAEVPEGVKHPFGDDPEPFSLCPTEPLSLSFLAGLYDALLPHFSSATFNVGLDETFDLGLGRSRDACEQRGRGRVYLDFLLAVHRLVSERGKRMQFWGDIIITHPELIAELPRDVIALEWGYEADHAFAEHARRYADSGLEFHVCPGTSSWNSLGGRATNALANLAAAATHGHANGASGYLITDWGDFGHLQPFAISYLGLIAGAELAWRPDRAGSITEEGVARVLDRLVFEDDAGVMGRALVDLGEAYRVCGGTAKNGSALFFLLAFPDDPIDHRRYRGVTTETLHAAEALVGDAATHLASARPRSDDGTLALRELRWVAEALTLACRIGRARLVRGAPVPDIDAATRRALRLALDPILEGHAQLWRSRSRPGGRADSVRRLLRLRERLT